MQFNTFSLFTILAAMVFIHMAKAGNLIVKNMCNFPVYCHFSSAANAATIPEAPPYQEVPAGNSLSGAYPANDDNVGVNVHCGLGSSVSDSDQYQLELAVDKGVSYADLSAVNGNPFLKYQRALNYPGITCPEAECAAGSTSCDWPVSINCNTEADIYMYLCGTY